jgi:predicted alpha/beta-fold hydrolase
MGSVSGHYWTFRPYVGHLLRPLGPPPSRHFAVPVEDERHGEVSVTGRLAESFGSDELLMIVHGLGGSSQSYYAIRAARTAHELGISSLRLNLRGADRSGTDIYHAGLTDDLRGALTSPRLARYRTIYLLGFSLGGHLALRYVAEGADPRVGAVAAVCAPLDLAAAAREIDRPQRAIYRGHLLRGLKEIYAAMARRRATHVPLAEAMRIRTMRTWDDLVVAPRFGFCSAEDYWARATVMPLLDHIEVPTLFVSATHDPMVLSHTTLPALTAAKTLEVVHVARAGHEGLPEDLDLGLSSPAAARAPRFTTPVDRQLVDWLRCRGEQAAHHDDATRDGLARGR